VFSEGDLKRMNYKWLDQKAILENSLHIRVFEEIKSKALD
jgi:hypothetical protein